ncbi:hypothetical protein F2Q69_00034963 [Brassica cretica]|uniref:Uncharacterized protein n=1 Tax=Brassica cretica TaxID=69181 RepID=A0A8S9SFF9_BRACR|nr:hypothetical protein F2Q69_00034963 [Brassica cretica]
MEGSPYRKISISRRKGGGSLDRTRKTPQRGTGLPSSGDPGNRSSFQRGSKEWCPAWGLEEFNT